MLEKNKPPAFWLTTFLLTMCLSPPTFANLGIDWLVATANPDGHYSTADDIANPFQATAETLRTFYQLGETVTEQPSMVTALDFINAATFPNTETQSRSLIINTLAYRPVDDQLFTRLNDNQGVGELANDNRTVIDTAWALEAIAITPNLEASRSQWTAALEFLLAQQHDNGGWTYYQNDTSAYTTAIVMHALWHYRHLMSDQPNLIPALDKAQQYLLTQRNSQELWHQSFESALALIAILPRLTSVTELATSVEALRSAQLANGSWNNDVYTTALALRALAIADSPQPNPDLGQIKGTVIDGQTGLPLSKVTIQLSGTSTGSQITNANGKFHFSGIMAGDYTIQIGNETENLLTAETVISPGQQINLGGVQFFRDTGTTAIQGTITHAKTGEPLPGVTITISNRNETIVTNAQGAYLISNIEPGEIIIQTSLAGYLTVTSTLTVTSGATRIVSLALSPDTATLLGVVTEAQTAIPLAGVNLLQNGTPIAQTSADGSYRIELPSGEHTIQIEHDGYESITNQLTLTAQLTLNYSPILSPIGGHPNVDSNAGLIGIVIDPSSQTPLTDVTVISGEQIVITDENGKFSFLNLTAGVTSLTLERTGYHSEALQVTLSAFTVLDLGEINLTPNDYVETAGIQGIIMSADTHQALSAIQIEAHFGDTTQQVSSQDDGTFEIAPLNEFEGSLLFTTDGYLPLTLNMSLVAGEILDLGQIRLRPTETVALLPDLTIETIDNSLLQTSLQTLEITGTLTVSVKNIGTAATTQPFSIFAFYDANLTENYEAQTDWLLGHSVVQDTFEVNTVKPIVITLTGELPFRDAPISVWLETEPTLVESDQQNNLSVSNTACSITTAANTIDFALCIDSSGSISRSQFKLQREATANAIEDPNVTPHDGSVRLTILQFSYYTRVEVPPTFIDSTNASEVANQIRKMPHIRNYTAIHSCINKAVNEIQQVEPVTDFQVINVSTDGYSSASLLQAASQRAIDAGIDVLNGLAIGSDADIDLLESIVFPQPPGGQQGYVASFSDYTEYASSISSYIQADTQVSTDDLTTARLHLLKHETDDTFSLNVRVGNGGVLTWPTSVNVTFFEGEPENNGIILGTVPLAELSGPEHQYQDIQLDGLTTLSGTKAIYAVVDFENQVAECNTDNNCDFRHSCRCQPDFKTNSRHNRIVKW